jgi:Ca-activated chloride channel family protein
MHEHNQDISVKLTAYLMGELDVAEAQEMERALADSAELRAEKARLESVIGLVREHGADDASLSREAHEAIASSAAGGKVHSITTHRQLSPMVNAASVLLLVGAAGALYVMSEDIAFTDSEVTELARAEGQAAVDGRMRESWAPNEQGLLAEKQAETKDKSGVQTKTVVVPKVEAGGASALVRGVGGGSAGGPGTPGPAGPSSPSPFDSSHFNSAIGIGGGGGGVAGGKWGGRFGGRKASSQPAAGGGLRLYYAEGAVAQDRLVTGSESFFLDQGEPVIRDHEITEIVEDDQEITGGLIEELDGGPLNEARAKERALELRRQQVELHSQRIIDSCMAFPDERPSAMFFRFWGDNAFVQTSLDSQSTFGVDVDTASYTLARRYLAEGNLPGKAQIRTEEFLNYFKPDVDAPTDGVFRVQTELAPSRFGGTDGKYMLRVTVRGKDVAREERQPLNLTFVVDVSGSMNQGNRLETVKHGLRLLTAQLDANDSIALVAYSKEARIVLPMTSAGSRALIEGAIHGLQAGGGTNAEAGLKMGYAAAADQISDGRNHRVVLLSDGVANIGETDQDRINADIKKFRDRGIYLNTIGVGMDNHNDMFLEQLANKGDGICNYIDDEKEARRALVENFTGAFEPIARDVKIQVEFESSIVKRYRQIGYENRAIADADFRNDAVDAGEVGAGHQVTALYELELESGAELVKGALAQVRLRWKEPTGADRDPAEDSATERQWATTLNSAVSLEGASYGFRRAICVAQFAELLRRSEHARQDSLDDLIAEAQRLEREHLAGTPGADDDFIEFIAMMERSKEVILNGLNSQRSPLEDCVRELQSRRYRHHSCIKLPGKGAEIQVLEEEIAELETQVRELMREQLR